MKSKISIIWLIYNFCWLLNCHLVGQRNVNILFGRILSNTVIWSSMPTHLSVSGVESFTSSFNLINLLTNYFINSQLGRPKEGVFLREINYKETPFRDKKKLKNKTFFNILLISLVKQVNFSNLLFVLKVNKASKHQSTWRWLHYDLSMSTP